eukprot:CAMPEP_0117443718 /NCGR_PEP_ID=MMETSP0759-20121206/4846_1 /TAXON_ID=63605 /ORGANISM="Percolomonas cosmopolitus, Strain WS" /LENGTH=354 /DNA_ID=CAMNT_0005235715 /DNA_START=43 /DNA_END=1104 /DNA_ORIENTATION=-
MPLPTSPTSPSHPITHYLTANPPTHILDIRNPSSFEKSHLPRSCNIPCQQLKDRMHEMPHGHSELVLVGDSWDDLVHVEHYLVEECQKSQRRILDVFLVQKHIEEELLTEHGDGYFALWDPNVHVKADIDFIEGILTGQLDENERQDLREQAWRTTITKKRETNQQQDTQNNECTLDGVLINQKPGSVTHVKHPLINLGPSEITPPKSDRKRNRRVTDIEAVDLGCGCGRDCVWLGAVRHWKKVWGIDNRSWRLKRMMDLARIMKAEDHVGALCVNLKKENLFEMHPELEASLDVVYAIRFLHKPLLAELGRLLKPGGLVVYCQFYKGANPPSKEKDILQEHEMRRIFRDWAVW